MKKSSKIVFVILGTLIILHAAFRMSGNERVVQIMLGLMIAMMTLWEKGEKKSE